MVNVRRWTLMGRTFMSAWILFVAPTAIAVVASGFKAPQLAVGFGFAVWALVWVWFWMRALGRRRAGEVVALLSLTAILTLFTLIQPSPAGTLLVFAFIVAGVAFPWRQAAWAIVALSVLSIVLLIVRQADAPTALNSLINSVLVGGVGVGTRQLWISYTELLEAREEIARLAVSEERLRFSRDVHDLLGQSLAMIVLKSELAARQLPADADDSVRHELQDVVRVARESLKDLREAVSGYRRPSLSGEISSARSACRAAGIAFVVDDRLGSIAQEQDAVLAWCVREAVTNVVKHSGARRCTLELARDEGFVRMHIGDDGRGTTSLDGGSGLTGMRERVEAAGGKLEVEPRAGGGLSLTIRLPAGAPATAELVAS